MIFFEDGMLQNLFSVRNFLKQNKLSVEIFERNLEEEPWYGIEQEFFIHDNRLYPHRVLGFVSDELNGGPTKQGQYYCSVGSNNAFGRELLEEHLGDFNKTYKEVDEDVSFLKGNPSKAKYELCWTPKYNIEEGIARRLC